MVSSCSVGSTGSSTLDTIDLLPGKSVFSLWALLKGLIVITAFVLITSVIARAIERRVMLLESLAPSTRVGISKFTYFFLLSLGILLASMPQAST